MGAGRRLRFIALAACLSLPLFCPPAKAAAELVPGLSCQKVGDFAQMVAAKRKQGASQQQLIADMKDEYKYKSTEAQSALEYIVHSIYAQPNITNTLPEAINSAFYNACRGTD